MRAHATLYLIAAVGNLFMAMLVVFRARKATGALPVALLSLALFTWDFGEGFHALGGGDRWKLVALIGSALAPAFLFHFIAVFTKREKLMTSWGAGVYGIAGLLAVSTAGAFLSGTLATWVKSTAWNVAYLAFLFPFVLMTLILLRRRHAELERGLERNALNFVATGIVVGAMTGFSDLAKVLGNPLPFLGHVGSLGASVILALAILRHRMLEGETPLRRTALALAIAAGAVAVNVWLFRRVDAESTLTVGGIAIATVVALALYRLMLLNWYESAERRRRLALIGTMAAGVAHEIKNPLASIKGAAQLVQSQVADGKTADAAEYLKLLVGEVDRLNGVIEDFLSYARPHEPRKRAVQLNEVVEEVLRLQQTALPAGVVVKAELSPTLPPVAADPDLMKHALINVIKNAIDAMPEGGTITIATKTVSAGWKVWAVLSVADTGPGVDVAAIEQLFQPFYTTKSKGTGLGLPIARRIVESHGGEISVENVPPHGARFSLFVPVR